MKKLCAMLFVLLLSAAISGCNSKTENTIPSETIEFTPQQTECTTIPTITETVPDSETYELTTEYDRTKLCLRFQPTKDTISGEDARYFTPIQQDKWISAFETALDKADTDAHGYTALLALSDRTGLIFLENEERFVSIIIEEVPNEGMVFTGLPKEKHFLEMVCDCFTFSDLANA